MAGADQLEGNSGNDTLDGGTGNDMLLGGTGTDTYNFSGQWGNDVVMDADGLGQITIDGNALTGGKKFAANTWMDADNQTTYTRAR